MSLYFVQVAGPPLPIVHFSITLSQPKEAVTVEPEHASGARKSTFVKLTQCLATLTAHPKSLHTADFTIHIQQGLSF
jgi:hypothetical protein